jgi:YggT family protein
MNLTEMDDTDAKRIVDFAAGLVFATYGSMERITKKVFLLSPANVDLRDAPAVRQARDGFFNQSWAHLSTLLSFLATVLWLYMLVLIGRLIFDWVQVFSRDWEPSGPLLIIAEVIYTVTDPPINFLRRFIPPLKLGQVSLDLSFLVLILGLAIVMGILNSLALTV